MDIKMISFKPNKRYTAEAERTMMPGIKTNVFNIKLETDEFGNICSFRDLTSEDLSMADIWDYLKLTDEETGEITDLRLHTAALTRNIDMAKEAIEENADLSLRMKQNSTPLHWAAAKGYFDIAELLVLNGAEVNAEDELGWTPLFLAANIGNQEIATLLVNNGALLKATINGKEVSLKVVHDLDSDLLYAAENGDFELAKSAIENGADVNAALEDGFSALHLAVKSSKNIVELLIMKGANPNVSSNRGYTPLMRAAGLCKPEIVGLLLSAGADTEMKDCDGKTAYQLFHETFAYDFKVNGPNHEEIRIDELLS